VTADGPEYGRLDRILAGPRPFQSQVLRSGLRRPWQVGDRQVYTLGGAWDGAAEFDRLRSMVAALWDECAALTDALGAVAHDFVPNGVQCDANVTFQGALKLRCGEFADAPVHRTPAVVRAELEAGS
jgi:hypothetical protein